MITKFRLSPCFLALLGIGLLSSSAVSFSREFFNPAFLTNMNGSDKNPDLSVFETENSQGPGKYRVDIIINDATLDTTDVEFFSIAEKSAAYLGKNDPATNLYPCFSANTLAGYGIRTRAIPTLKIDSNGCVIIKSIPDASVDFNFNLQKIILSIPQAAISTTARGYVSPESFDQGINALFLNYHYNGNNSYSRNNDTTDQQTHSVNLLPGLNFGAWRLRNFTTWNKSDSNKDSSGSWDTVYTYLERNIIALKSNLTLGESSSESDVYDSVPFRGVQLASDDFMDPESTQGYAPVVRGIAKGNAKVVIKQNGYVIYQSFVPPGAFEITDLYSTGGNGDLNVTIEEADGSQQNYVVAYASLPVLRREGSLKYGITTGQYRSSDSSVDDTPFTQITASYGLALNATAYGGAQLASKYQSIVMGLGKNLGEFGAVSLDLTQAWSTKKDEDKNSGQSLRVRYSKNLNDAGTNISIAGYRYSTSGFSTLSEVMETYRDDYRIYTSDRVKNRTEITVSQSLGEDFGYVNIGGVMEDYWNERRRNNTLNIGYSNSWKGITYNLNYAHNRSSTDNPGNGRHYATDKIFSLNVNVPLDRWLSNTWATYGLNTSSPGSTSNSVGLSGIALEDHNLNWNMQQQYDNRDSGSGNAGLDYKGTYGEVFGSYNYDKNWQRVNYGASGSIIAHADGITAGQSISDTTALVKAPGAEGTRVIGNSGVKTDFRGYAIVPNISMYRQNDVILDTETMPDDVELDTTTATVIPTRGAIVLAEYIGKKGIRAMLQLVDTQNNYIPFGAIVTNTNGENTSENSSIVSDNGQVYMTGLPQSGSLIVKWGKKATQACNAAYQFPDTDNSNGIKQTKLICR
ncbi:fimbria/pilus outer membrane usher protein [Leclercia tamurae]|uniref:Fimbrial biogenesis outer membrane usher protein n=1 Tax=Leclercia tamurae TaxID=2926467 RepID=A0ABT2RC86_9ENTR|nr:fimbria/pilus outer membrane usher protein [Leclercia tamurae]MCU6678493.1 fimbrial biogenesis outer membrane usher protein [Leclercia tamurae]